MGAIFILDVSQRTQEEFLVHRQSVRILEVKSSIVEVVVQDQRLVGILTPQLDEPNGGVIHLSQLKLELELES